MAPDTKDIPYQFPRISAFVPGTHIHDQKKTRFPPTFTDRIIIDEKARPHQITYLPNTPTTHATISLPEKNNNKG